jgi:micrococcal nuclease
VERVIDGDTLVMNNGERLRLIGVDTPETQHAKKPVQFYGREATTFTRRMVEGKRVRLEFDAANAPRAHKDSRQQRRTLAYVFLKDGILLNAEIIKQGYGFAYTRFPFARMEEFTHLERDAQEQLRRLWAFAMSRD